MRSEAKLEQLRAKVKSQSEEIATLREFNQSLLRHIEDLRSKGKDGMTPGGDGGEEPGNDFFLQQMASYS